jgi:hypothetical protein
MINKINHKMGYYSVGTDLYNSKIDACIAGTKQNVHPVWHFSDHVWQKQNWKHEPEVDLLELYKMRARQIREQYDYVIIYYSGGSDSHTMVEAFIKAGCRIDEIYTIWTRKGNKNFIPDPSFTEAKNIEAEFDLTTKDGLTWIKKVSPSTKITYLDITDAVINYHTHLDGEEWLANTTEMLSPEMVTRWSATREYVQLKLLDRGLKTAAVFGVDKPRICIKDGKYHAYFIDSIPNCFHGPSTDPNFTNLTTEFFYWTPDFPEIVIKQAHVVRRWFEANPNVKFLLNWPNTNPSRRTAYEIITRSIVYPEWDQQKFQCVKVSKRVFEEWSDWFFASQVESRTYNSWYQGIKHVEQNVDRRYLYYDFENLFNGFVGMINGHFALE